MAHPDILADPTAELNNGLRGETPLETAQSLQRLHRHILAGGALPAQWRGEGTETSEDKLRAEHETESGAALAELAHGVTAAAGLLSRNGFDTMADLLRRRLAAVTGED